MHGTRSLNGGKFYWEVTVSPRLYGTSVMFGVGTLEARTVADTFTNLLGQDSNSWGLSHKGLLWHEGTCRTYTTARSETTDGH